MKVTVVTLVNETGDTEVLLFKRRLTYAQAMRAAVRSLNKDAESDGLEWRYSRRGLEGDHNVSVTYQTVEP